MVHLAGPRVVLAVLVAVSLEPRRFDRFAALSASDGWCFLCYVLKEISAKDSYDVQYFKGGGEFRLAVPVMRLSTAVGRAGGRKAAGCQVPRPDVDSTNGKRVDEWIASVRELPGRFIRPRQESQTQTSDGCVRSMASHGPRAAAAKAPGTSGKHHLRQRPHCTHGLPDAHGQR